MDIHDRPEAVSRAAAERASANFRLAIRLAVSFVAVLWLVQWLITALELGPEIFGVRPRQLAGLIGIASAPLVHGDFAHLLSNSLPLIVAGATMLYLYPQSSLRVLPAVWFGPGLAVWLLAAGSSHIGASGIVYGLVAYIFFAGLIRRDRRAIAASLLVSFMYGALVWGVLPIKRGVSWETHLAAAIIGVGLAFALRALDVLPRRRYSWEYEAEVARDERERIPGSATISESVTEHDRLPGTAEPERTLGPADGAPRISATESTRQETP